MPRKTKEIKEEQNVKKSAKIKPVKEKSTKSVAKLKTEKKTPKKATKTKVEVKTKKSAKTKLTEKKTTRKTPKKAVKTTTKSSSRLKTFTKTKSRKVDSPSIVEYYDLPYKYNQTVVKVLYQNPTTLFVYWEISDNDIANYKAIYGEDFFETTKPVLIVYNDTKHYHFEFDLNDFANCWYFNIKDSKCDYRVELIRRPIVFNKKIKTEYVHISSSNKIESPNDRILFSTNESYTVYFKNTKNNNLRKVNLPKLLDQLNLTNKSFAFPIVRNVYDLYKFVYHIDDVGEFSVDLTNPSSRGKNPSSHSLSSRFTY